MQLYLIRNFKFIFTHVETSLLCLHVISAKIFLCLTIKCLRSHFLYRALLIFINFLRLSQFCSFGCFNFTKYGSPPWETTANHASYQLKLSIGLFLSSDRLFGMLVMATFCIIFSHQFGNCFHPVKTQNIFSQSPALSQNIA